MYDAIVTGAVRLVCSPLVLSRQGFQVAVLEGTRPSVILSTASPGPGGIRQFGLSSDTILNS
jgi:hypothetical protein